MRFAIAILLAMIPCTTFAAPATRQAAIDARKAAIVAQTAGGEAMELAEQTRGWMAERRLDALNTGNVCVICGQHWTLGDGHRWLGDQRYSDGTDCATIHWAWGNQNMTDGDASATVQIMEIEQQIDIDGDHKIGDFSDAVAFYQDAEVDYEDCKLDADSAESYYQSAGDEYELIADHDCGEGEE